MSNLSQTRRAEMLEYLNHLKEIHTDDESRIALEKIETALTEKKYGLVWEEHVEEVDKQLVHNIPVFKEIEDKKIVRDNTTDFNFLLEGDNLHSLKLLDKTHKGNIDVIYIDPPYNTGNKDFIYDDNYIGSDDGYRHSKWLSFMNERLTIARELLSDEGVIFISIDNNEQAQLKLLCDSIFGEKNLISIIPRITSPQRFAQEKNINISNDFIIAYSNTNRLNLKKIIQDTDSENLKQDKIGHYYEGDTKALIAPISQGYSRNCDYDVEFNGKIYSPVNSKGVRNRWFWTEERMKTAIKLGIIRETKNSIRMQIYQDKAYDVKTNSMVDKEIGVRFTTLDLINNIYSNPNGVSDYEKFNISKKFSNPKPVSLIKTIINLHPNNNAIILDFFAGSGTTGQAVMELNKEDGGSRKFILCTNNENNICEDITYERLSRVIKGYDFEGKIKDDLKSYNLNISNLKKMDSIFQEFEDIKFEKKDEYDKFLNQSKDGVLKLIGEKEILDKVAGIPHNLKYYKTEFIPKLSEYEEILASKLLDYIKEMVELENMCEIDVDSRRIILSDEDLKIALSEMEEGSVLYIPSFILLTNEIKNSIEERKLEVVTIPDYYFTEELREVNEL